MLTLHGYFRSGATYRVRIVLNLKGLAYENRYLHLRRGQHNSMQYRAINPQGLVPTLEANGAVLSQSLAICEYLDEIHPEPPLLPADATLRARVRAFAQVIACDIHPLQNLKVLDRLRESGLAEEEVTSWAARVIADGLDACATLIAGQGGPFCFGDALTLADVCLVPQLVNARRFGVKLRWTRLLEVEAACLALEAFQRAAPESQADAE